MVIAQATISISPPVALAPMAGITDLPFRRLVASFGVGLVVSEMVASREMVCGGALARHRARHSARPGVPEVPLAVQLVGRDPAVMAEAARMVEGAGARIIDINMGCPAKKVTGGAAGSALLREPERALRIIEAVVEAVSVPVTLKTRLGWDDACTRAAPLLARAEAAGVRMITLHGRTRCAFYRGQADWAAIGRLGSGLGVPVLANGDIDGSAAARAALAASGAAGVMVGRAARGRPWLPAQIAAALRGGPRPRAPSGAALSALVAGHYEAMLSHYGRAVGVRAARKHLGWYMDAAVVPPALRREILTATAPADVLRRLPSAFAGSAGDGLAA